MPLRSILQDFLDYVAGVDAACDHQQPDHYDREFQELKVLTDEIRAQNSCNCGEKEVNRRKNRYKDILPYDFNRVTLSEVPGVDGEDVADSDYINASYIKGASGSKAYIASQAPLPHTVDDFWRMIFETDVQVIVMTSNEIEAGRPKCERYWPNDDEEKVFGNITVTLEQQREMCEDFKVKRLKAKRGDSPPRTLHHFHYHNWPDHGIPMSVTAILDMVELIRRDFQPSETLPVLVHCSAGCGRTGTVCAIDFVWGLLRTGKLSEDFSLKQLVLDLRRQRIAMVQTKEQYILVHRAVKELFERHLKVIDDHPYENVDFSGKPLGLKDEPDYANVIKDDVNPYENVMLPTSGTCDNAAEENHDGGSGERRNSLRSVDKVEPKEVPSIERPSPLLNVEAKSEGTANTRIPDDESAEDGRNRSPISSKMEYVNDWCAGIGTTSADAEKEPSLRLQQQSDDGTRVASKRLSVSDGSTGSSSATSLARSKASAGGRSNRERPIISLVRKPSVAKLRELFGGSANSDNNSSSPPSPENWPDSPSPRFRRERAATDPLINDDPSGKENDVSSGANTTASLVKSKRQTPKRSKIRISDEEYKNLVSRYMDVSLQIFKENKQFAEDEKKKDMWGSRSHLKLPQVSPTLSASSEGGMIGTTTASSNVSTGNQSLSSLLPTRDSSDVSSLSPGTLRHSPSPSHSPSPGSRDRSEKVSDFVGRLVRSRRNSASEKRSSTWYDEMPCNEDVLRAEEEPPTVKSPNRMSQLFGVDVKEKNSGAVPVKRSISMKVGFGSPFIRRRRNPKTDVAAYLAVEDNRKKSDVNRVAEGEKAIRRGAAEVKSTNAPSAVKQQSKLSRKLHGYVNVRPAQNATRYVADGGPVELKNYSPRGDDVILLRASDGGQRPPLAGSPQPTRKYGYRVADIVPADLERASGSSLNSSPLLSRRREGSPVVDRPGSSSPASTLIGQRRTGTESPHKSRGLVKPASRDAGSKTLVDHGRRHAEENLVDPEVSEVVQRLERELRKRSSIPSNYPTSSSTRIEESRPSRQKSEMMRVSSSGNRDDLYGAEMDEYCQQMLEDCRDYLLSHQYTNMTDEARRNIRWIEDTIHRSPRHAIMDVTSSTENLFGGQDKDAVGCGDPTSNRSRLSSGPHNYEKLWLSHSGQDDSREIECSVDEATIDFPPQYDDEDDEDDYDRNRGEQQSRSQWFHTENQAPSRTNYISSPSLSRQAPKDKKFCQTVDELQTLIDDLDVENIEKKRKPHPAPRTVLNVPANFDVVRNVPHAFSSNEGSDATAHVYDVVCEDVQPSRQPKVKHLPLLGSSNVRSFAGSDLRQNRPCLRRHGSDSEDGSQNHEYEEILFRDDRPKWTADRDLAYRQYHPLFVDRDDLVRRTSVKNGVDSSAVAVSGAGLYGQVNKPRRRKHSLSQEVPLTAADSRNRRYDAMMRTAGESTGSNRDYRVPLMVPPRTSDEVVSAATDDDDSMLRRPVAPPRIRRQYISSSFSAQHGVSSDAGHRSVESNVPQSGFYSSEPQMATSELRMGYCNDNADEEVGAPPVPVKTKDAYVPLLAKENVSSGVRGLPSPHDGHDDESDNGNATRSSNSTGISYGKKKLNKIHTSLFSKLGLKSDKDSGGTSPKSTRKVNLTELKYSHRLDKQPTKSPREPPAHWKVTTA